MQYISHPLLVSNKIEARLYQELLVDCVLEKGNTLIVAPTALGKTMIAAVLAAKVLEKKPNSKILFLAPTKPLAVQHYQTLEKVMKIDGKFALLTGALLPQERRREWEESQIISGTPQAIENDILSRKISLNDVGLVIFDEAHRAVHKYAYVYIADQYEKQCSSSLILGLTASPGSSREKIQEVCHNLYIDNIEVKREQDEDVVQYIKEKTVVWKKVKFPTEFQEIKKLLEQYMTDRLGALKNLSFVEKNRTRALSRKELLILQDHLGRRRSSDKTALIGLSITAALMKVHHGIEMIETQGLNQFVEYIHKLPEDGTRASKNIIRNQHVQKAIANAEALITQGQDHPKVQLLIDTVKEELKTSENIIVFAHFRNTADRLVSLLRQNNIECQKFIGQATRGKDKGLSQKEQTELIEKFRAKEFRVLVATRVAEEGLDIPNVDSVVFYEPVPSEIRNIQRRGRTGREHEGRIIVLMTENTRDETYYWSSISKEKRMHKVLDKMSTQQNIKQEEKQQTLSNFSSKAKQMQDVTIYTDIRENPSGIVPELLKYNIQVKEKRLDVGDFLISDRVVIERKSANDFIGSIINGRLFKQADELSRNFERPIVLIEGSPYGLRNIHDNAIRGAIASIMVNYNIGILQTKDLQETAAMIAFLAKREQLGEFRNIRLRGEKRAMPPEDQKQFIVESLPGIGPQTAKQLLEHLGTVEKVFTADERELREVEGVGPKRAKETRKLVTEEYKE